MNFNKSEIFIHFLIIILAIVSIHYGVKVLDGSDFANCFYQAGLGNLDVKTLNSPGWVYKDWTAIFFIPLTWFNVETSYLVYSAVNTISFLILSHLVMSKKYGWILVLAILPIFKELLQSNATQVPFALLCCYPLPTVLAILFKPHHFVFAVIHTYRSRNAESRVRAIV